MNRQQMRDDLAKAMSGQPFRAIRGALFKSSDGFAEITSVPRPQNRCDLRVALSWFAGEGGEEPVGRAGSGLAEPVPLAPRTGLTEPDLSDVRIRLSGGAAPLERATDLAGRATFSGVRADAIVQLHAVAAESAEPVPAQPRAAETALLEAIGANAPVVAKSPYRIMWDVPLVAAAGTIGRVGRVVEGPWTIEEADRGEYRLFELQADGGVAPLGLVRYCLHLDDRRVRGVVVMRPYDRTQVRGQFLLLGDEFANVSRVRLDLEPITDANLDEADGGELRAALERAEQLTETQKRVLGRIAGGE